MNTPHEQRRIERERRKRIQKKQTEAKHFPGEQNNGEYTPMQTESQSFHRMTPDELFRPEPAATDYETEKSENMHLPETKPFAAHQWFVTLALIFGVVFVFLTPPFQVPDEIKHFFKSY